MRRRVKRREYATIRLGNVRLELDRPHWTPRRSLRSCRRCSVRLERISPKHPMLAQTRASSRKSDRIEVEKPRYLRMVVVVGAPPSTAASWSGGRVRGRRFDDEGSRLDDDSPVV
jgi:hypothetical protein